MSEWPSFVLLFRPPIFEHEAVDERNVVEEVENVRVELMLEGKLVPTAPSMASPQVLFPSACVVFAKTVADTLGVVVGVVRTAGDQDLGEEENVKVEVVASMLLTS